MNGGIKDLQPLSGVRLDLHDLRIGRAALLIHGKSPRRWTGHGKGLQESDGGCRKLPIVRSVQEKHATPTHLPDPARDLVVGIAAVKLARADAAVAENVQVVLQAPVEDLDLTAGKFLLQVVGEGKNRVRPLAGSTRVAKPAD